MAGLSALFVAFSVLLWWPDADRRLVRRLRARPMVRQSGKRRLGPLIALGASAMVVLGWTIDGRRGAALALVVAIGGVTAVTLGRRGRRRSSAAGAALEVSRAAEALSGLLRVGAIPSAALIALAEDHPVLAEARAEDAVGGDVVAALRRGSVAPGRAGLGELAAAWEVAMRTGASMEASIDAIAEDLHRRQESATSVRVELAAARAAGRLLAVLPLAGLGLGYAFGGNPVGFLTGQWIGQLCLIVAAAFMGVGLVWTDVLADRASQ